MKNSSVISLRLPVDLHDRIKELAEALDRPANWVMRKAIEEYLQRQARAEEAYREGP